jgi:DNA-binding response OmpR family regulator
MNEKKQNILWVDDEIDLLGGYLIFLEEKGYAITTATNGIDALSIISSNGVDIVFLDENMPGISGFETLSKIKQINPSLPIVMITKNEAENIMDMAIGNQIADYLTKPVNPSQILLTLKKHLHRKDIVKEQVTTTYGTEFSDISNQINFANSSTDWEDIYKKLVFWDLRLDATQHEMYNLLLSQKEEANLVFSKYIAKNYLKWFEQPDSRPLISPDIFKKRIFPLLDEGNNVFLVVIDNFRYDQWKMVQDVLNDLYVIDNEEFCFSILPTTTQYSRNAIFSGLMPLQIREMYPQFWVEDDEAEGKNIYEKQLIGLLLERYKRKINFSYHKINNSIEGEKLASQISTLKNNPLNVCVLNFIDMLSHTRTESKMMRELAQNEIAYRALAVSWFKHSSALSLFKALAANGFKVVVTSDHGTIRVNKAIKTIGDRNTNTNLRYKVGKALSYNKKEVFEILQPAKALLPSPNISSSYIFASGNDFMAYPNNFNYYASYFKETFQHGGISLEEMLVPLIVMKGK